MAQRKDTPRERLTKRAEEIEELRESEHNTAFAGDQREVTGELSLVRQHPADIADFTYQRELQQTTQELLDREAQQVEDALRRQAEGTYGVCQSCGRKIPAERLRARPEATFCVDCQREREGGGTGG
jgi:RNA polymerase-binding transcription factor DksA